MRLSFFAVERNAAHRLALVDSSAKIKKGDLSAAPKTSEAVSDRLPAAISFPRPSFRPYLRLAGARRFWRCACRG